MNNISHTAKELIEKVLKKENSSVLILESHPQMVQGLEQTIEGLFGKAFVHCFEGPGKDENSFETHIKKGEYDMFVVGDPLSEWGSDEGLIGKGGLEVVQYIREKRPSALILFFSTKDRIIRLVHENSWADIVFDKVHLGDFASQVMDIKESL